MDGTMTDNELVAFLGITDLPEDQQAKLIAGLGSKHATYEQMHRVEVELGLWQAGLGSKPSGVIVCREHTSAKGRNRI